MRNFLVLVGVLVMSLAPAVETRADVVAIVGSSSTPIATAANGADLTINLGEIDSYTTVRILTRSQTRPRLRL